MTAKMRDAMVKTIFEEAPRLLYENGYSQNNGRCIISSRIVLEVARHFQLSPRAVPVMVRVCNQEALKMFERFRRVGPLGHIEADAIVAIARKNGAYELITDIINMRDNRYPGHLVVSIGNRLIDLDFGQFSRPQRGVVLPRSAVFDVDYNFWGGSDHVYQVSDGLVCYKLLKNPLTDYRNANDWKEPWRWRPIVENLVESIRRKLLEKITQ